MDGHEHSRCCLLLGSASFYISFRCFFLVGLWEFFLSMKSHSWAKLSPAPSILFPTRTSCYYSGTRLGCIKQHHVATLDPCAGHRIHLTWVSESPFSSSPMNSNSHCPPWLVLVWDMVVDPFSFPYSYPGSTERL